jgi:hypothetical protein
MYEHLQTHSRGKMILIAMSIMSSVCIVLGATVSRPIFTAVPFFIVAGWLFHSLTIEIADGELRWRFGPGLIHKHVSLNEVAEAQSVRTNVLEGWGIHLSRFGWLYNVSGFDAVAIKLKNGRSLCLGTDEPQALLAVLGLFV